MHNAPKLNNSLKKDRKVGKDGKVGKDFFSNAIYPALTGHVVLERKLNCRQTSLLTFRSFLSFPTPLKLHRRRFQKLLVAFQVGGGFQPFEVAFGDNGKRKLIGF